MPDTVPVGPLKAEITGSNPVRAAKNTEGRDAPGLLA